MSVESDLAARVAQHIAPSVGFRQWVLILLAVFAVGLGVGAWGMHAWQVSDLRENLIELKAKLAHREKDLADTKTELALEKLNVKTKTEVRTETQVAYVPKETIRYIDPATGKAAEKKDDTDAKFTFNKPGVVVSMNGQKRDFGLLYGEKQKFENGMLVMNQDSTINIDVSADVRAGVKAAMQEVVRETRHTNEIILMAGPGIQTGILKLNQVAIGASHVDGQMKYQGGGTVLRF